MAVEVWMRPWDSVAGTRCTRCTPPSKRIREYTRSPLIDAMISLSPPALASLLLRISILQPTFSA